MILEYQSKYKKILLAIAVMLLIGGISYIAWSEFSPKISNSGPPLPEVSDGQGIRGTVLLGPVCPVVKDPPDPDCLDKPYATKLVLTTADQSRVITEFSSDNNGKFEIKVQPGEYAIRSAVAANILPYCSTNDTILVNANSYAETIVYCDTGIR